MLSEKEAAGKWCPQAVVVASAENWRPGDPTAAANRAVDESGRIIVTGPVSCIGSRCMAWRWVMKRQRGFCGLAGRPS